MLYSLRCMNVPHPSFNPLTLTRSTNLSTVGGQNGGDIEIGEGKVDDERMPGLKRKVALLATKGTPGKDGKVV